MNTSDRTLRQILRHEVVRRSLEQLAARLGTSFHLIDKWGATLSGDSTVSDGPRTPICCGDAVAWLIAPRHGDALAVMLDGLIALEREKKAVAADALDMYREINLLFHLHESMTDTLNLGEVCDSLASETCRLLGCTSSLLYLADAGSKTLQLAAGAPADQYRSLHFGEGIIGYVFETGVADIFNHVGKVPGLADSTDSTAMICTPLKAAHSRLGILVALRNTPFSANDLKLLTSLASHGAMVLRNAQLYTELQDMFQSTVSVLAETIEKRDPYTAGHTQRVTNYSVKIAQTLDLPLREIEDLRLSAILHDVGKIGIRDHILLKTTPLNGEEMQLMKQHTEHGADILNRSRLLRSIIDGVRYHHERFDGKGYNHSLKGGEIPLHARIIAVSDSFDAMTTDRPYRKGLDVATALNELRNGAGSQFDPAIVEAFLSILAPQTIATHATGNPT